MSDFDKEAEREKLREQFAEDEQKRETTERMSQLLLQGATMTNVHCDTCGDPLFRYEGQTFCATCQRATDEGNAGAPAGETTATNETAVHEGAMTGESQRIAVESQSEAPDSERSNGENSSPERTPSTARPAQTRRTPPSQSSDGSGRQGAEQSSGLAEAEQSLARTVVRQTSAAEEAGDLGRTREHLAAAREAAEALAAVRQASR